MEEVRNIQATEEFIAAAKLVKEGKYEEAVDAYSTLVGSLVEKHGDLGSAMAPVYYAYGSSCLLQVESSANIFGESVKRQDEENKTEMMETDVKEKVITAENKSAEVSGNEAQPEGEGEEQCEEVDDVILALCIEYKKQHGEEPTDEVLKQWTETIKAANIDATHLQQNKNGSEETSVNKKMKDTTSENISEAGQPMGKAIPSTETKTKEEGSDVETKLEKEDDNAKENLVKPSDLTAADIDDLMGIAWECLETSRIIYSKLLETLGETDTNDVKECKKLLSKTMLRLGDHSMESGKFDQSVEDYEKCLGLRMEVFPLASREIPDVCCNLANAYLYASSEDDKPENVVLKRLASIQNYATAVESLLQLQQTTLGVEQPHVFSEKLTLQMLEEEEEEEKQSKDTDGDAEANKGKVKQTKESFLSAQAIRFISKIKERLEKVASMSAVVEVKTEDEQLKKEGEDIAKLVLAVKEKAEDVLLLLENKEASEAVTKSVELVEEALKEASSCASAFDKPTLDKSNGTDPENAAPTNLLTARKKATTPDDVKADIESALKEAETANEGEKNEEVNVTLTKPEVIKRKACDVEEVSEAPAKRTKV